MHEGWTAALCGLQRLRRPTDHVSTPTSQPAWLLMVSDLPIGTKRGNGQTQLPSAKCPLLGVNQAEAGYGAAVSAH